MHVTINYDMTMITEARLMLKTTLFTHIITLKSFTHINTSFNDIITDIYITKII